MNAFYKTLLLGAVAAVTLGANTTTQAHRGGGYRGGDWHGGGRGGYGWHGGYYHPRAVFFPPPVYEYNPYYTYPYYSYPYPYYGRSYVIIRNHHGHHHRR